MLLVQTKTPINLSNLRKKPAIEFKKFEIKIQKMHPTWVLTNSCATYDLKLKLSRAKLDNLHISM